MREVPSVGESSPPRSVAAGPAARAAETGAARTAVTGRSADRRAMLAAGFAALVAVVWTLIVLGALVRANDAGLACPDWPLCFGAWVPRFDVRVAFEYSHRVLAGIVTLAFALLAGLAWRESTVGPGIRRLIAIAALLLAVQILLGALTVWQLLASWTVTSHLVTGNSVAVALLFVALSLRESGTPVERAAVPASAHRALLLAAALLGLQIVLGGLVSSRYAGLACLEWPTCNAGIWFPSLRGPVGLHLLHRVNAYGLLVALAVAAWLCRQLPRLRRVTGLLLVLGLLQGGVGIANVLLALPVEVTGLHSALAAALVLLAAVALRESFAARSGAC